MTTFDNREHAFETKFAHDQETQFNIIARRNKLLGLWAAEKMRLSEENTKNYVASLVEKTAQHNSANFIAKQIEEDFATAEVNIEKAEIEKEMHNFLKKATDQIVNGRGD